MSSKKLKVAIWSNTLFIKTGLSRNAKALLKEFYKSEKYELFHYCTGVSEADPKLNMYPWKTVGCLPSSQQEMAELNRDPHRAKMAAYGNLKIKDFVKDNEIDVLIASDDLWGVGEDIYNSEWIKDINFFFHCTLDSLPLIETTKNAAMNSNFVSWAKFGEVALKEDLKKHDLKPEFDPITIHGAIESEHFHPITNMEKIELRRKFNIDQDATIFVYVARNQLRKKFDSLLQAFASYKKQNPSSKSKILLHTSWTEGWNLNRLIETLGIDKKDILTTHVCGACKTFEIKPYNGEGQNCRFCGAEKSQGSANINNGVADEEMKYIYGIADAGISLFTSGGMEIFNIESLMCGNILATIGYSCGESYLSCKEITEIRYNPTREINSCFIKAEPNVNDVIKFMKKVEEMKPQKRREIGLAGRKWALKEFDSKVVAGKWMEQIDKCEVVDHSNIRFDDNKTPNPQFQPDFNLEGNEFIKSLYSGFLDSHYPDDQGMAHWSQRIENGEPKEQIAQIFQQIAVKDLKPEPIDIRDLLLDNDKKNLFFVLKESLGDCILSLSLLEGARLSYPDHNINVVTEEKFFDVFRGCEFVDNLIPFSPMLENEMAVIGAGKDDGICDVFILPAVATQKHLNYLSNNQPEMLEVRNNNKDWTLQTK